MSGPWSAEQTPAGAAGPPGALRGLGPRPPISLSRGPSLRGLLAVALAALALACAPRSAPPLPKPTAGPPAALRPAPLPAALAARAWSPPEQRVASLSNGLELRVVEQREVPLFQLSLLCAAGPPLDPPGLEGTAATTFDLLDEGAAGRDSAALAAAAQRLGGMVAADVEGARGVVTVLGSVQNMDGLLDIWADVILRPDFPAPAMELVRQRQLAHVARRRASPTTTGTVVVDRSYWGSAGLGRVPVPESLRRLERLALQRWYREQVGPGSAAVVAAGALSLEELLPRLEARLGGWRSPAALPPPAPPAGPLLRDPRPIRLVHRLGSPQMLLRSMIPGPSPESPDWQAFVVAATALGEGPTSRVGRRLREELGWSYSPGCQVQPHAGGSLWTCALPVESAHGGEAIAEVERIIAEYRDQRPLSEEELLRWRGYLLRSTPASFDTTAGTLSWQASLWTLRLAPGWLGPHLAALGRVDLGAARAAAQRWLDPQKLGWAAVGDGGLLVGQARAVEPVDADGLPLPP